MGTDQGLVFYMTLIKVLPSSGSSLDFQNQIDDINEKLEDIFSDVGDVYEHLLINNSFRLIPEQERAVIAGPLAGNVYTQVDLSGIMPVEAKIVRLRIEFVGIAGFCQVFVRKNGTGSTGYTNTNCIYYAGNGPLVLDIDSEMDDDKLVEISGESANITITSITPIGYYTELQREALR